jgi:hypothetical protein
MGFFSKIRRKVKKIIPKEIRPFVPYLAAMIPGMQAMGPLSGIGSLAARKALIAGGTKFLTDDEADLKDIGITAALAGGPSALQEYGASSLPGANSFLGEGATAAADKMAKSKFTTLAAQGGIDAGIKAAELNEEALEKYNRDLAAQGINDKAGRRAAIRSIYSNTGTWDMDEVDGMLDTYGYRTGGRVNYKEGGEVDEYKHFQDMLEVAQEGLASLEDKSEVMPIRELRLKEGGSVDDKLMERVKELQDEGLDFASAMAQAMKEDMASGKAMGGIMDVNMEETIDTPKGDMTMDENIKVADSTLMDAYKIYRFDMMEQGLEPMSLEEFKDQAMSEGKMANMDYREFIYDASRDNFANDMFGKDYGDLNEEETEEVDIIIEMELGKNQAAPERTMAASGGRIGLKKGGDIMKAVERGISADQALDMYNEFKKIKEKYGYEMSFDNYLDGEMFARGGRVGKNEGGLMNLGGREMDLRGGGFVPMGKAERADDVPARLSKNEFVMTADAVRAAGGGSVKKGADLMYDQMKQLERQA